ncbi:MAG: RagB/SusD family nutrient uptake outer membrane protein [Bacteroidales bacterium]|nr:RagB/SusD family nutrient uptake outer membrane protein [Bacteroidales bacterium]
MMKKVFYISILILTLGGCENFLENETKGFVADEDFYKNINEFQAALNSVYAVLREPDFQKTLAFIGDAMSDDFIYQSTKNNEFGNGGFELQNFLITADNAIVERWYKINYKGIYRANQLISHINDPITIKYFEGHGEGDDQIIIWQHIYGQVLFLRAYYYFNLVQVFGGISLMPERIDIENPAIARSSVEETYKYIEKDLRLASVLLKTKPGDKHYGEVSQYAALGMLLKVLVTQAQPAVVSEKWEEAAFLGQFLVSSAKSTTLFGTPIEQYGNITSELTFNDVLQLEKFFPQLTWDEFKEKYKLNMLFDTSRYAIADGMGSIQSAGELNGFHKFNENWSDILRLNTQNLTDNFEAIFVVPSMQADGINSSNFNFENYCDFLYSWGYKTDQAFIPSVKMKDFMETNNQYYDPRNEFGSFGHGMQNLGYIPAELNDQFGGVGTENFQIFIKWWLAKDSERPTATNVKTSPRNLTLLRYSDVVLLYAEAKNEVGDPMTAVHIINDLRAHLNESASLTKTAPDMVFGPVDQIREKIREERRKEFVGEKIRYFDLLRWGIAGDVLPLAFANEVANSKQGISFIKGKHELFPIPQIEFELSHGVIEQNPGY